MSTASHAIGLNGRLAARWARRAVDRLRKERAEIDELNVFPVPDGDTGTNMYHTLRSAYLAVEELTGPVTLPQVVAALADGAGRGARGNSGLILSVALRGVADALEGVTVATAESLADALELASIRARAAVARPVDGTMLTVLDAMATEAHDKVEEGADLVELVRAVRARSRSALRETTSQLDVLSEAEVVDAGSTGIVELFDLLYATVTGRTPQDSMLGEVAKTPKIVHQATVEELEIVAILSASAGPEVAAALEGLGGTSIVVNGAKVHVHVSDEAHAARVLDHLGGIGILRLDMEDLRLHEEEGETLLVALANGTGLLLHAALNGATVLAPTMPAARATLTEMIAAEERRLVVVPSSTTALRALYGLRGASVIRSRNVATLLSALAVHDPFAPCEEIVADMTEAAAGTRMGLVVGAAQLESNPPTGALPLLDDVTVSELASGGPLAAAALAVTESRPRFRVLIDGKVRSEGTDLITLVETLAERLLGAGGELLTVVHGCDCPPRVLSQLRAWVEEKHAHVHLQEIDVRDRSILLSMGVE